MLHGRGSSTRIRTEVRPCRCATKGEVCHEICGATPPMAECMPPLPAIVTACDPNQHVADSCATSTSFLQCDYCYANGGDCDCFLAPKDCSSCLIGMKKVACKCVVMLGPVQGSKKATCVDASLQTCNPSTSADICVGTTAQRCLGTTLNVDCAAHGQICQLSNKIAGCTDPAAASCVTSTTSCDNNSVVACCPANGVYQAGVTRIYCTPGQTVKWDCSKLAFPYTCDPNSSTGGAGCE